MAQSQGVQNPGKYPVQVGDKYLYYGEQPGYIYNPYTDSYVPDPKTAKPYLEETGLLEPEPKEPGLGEKLLPVAGTAVAIAGANELAKQGVGMFGGASASGAGAGASGAAGATQGAGMMGAGASQGAAGVASPTVVGGAQIPAGSEAAVTAAQETAAKEIAAEAGGAWQDYLPYVGYALMALDAYKTLSDDDLTDAQKSQQLTKAAGLAVAGYFTAGIVPMVYAGASMIPGFEKAEAKYIETSPGMQGVGSWGTVAGGGGKTKDFANIATTGISGALQNITGKNIFGSGKTTDQYQAERWSALDEDEQGLYAANHGGGDTWEDGKYAGEKWTFDKAKDLAMEDPTHFVGVLGNLEATKGSDIDWLNTDPEVQKAAVAQAVREDLYYSDKGDVRVTDPERFQEIVKEQQAALGIPSAEMPMPTDQPVQPQDQPIDTSGGANDPGRNPNQTPPVEQAPVDVSNPAPVTPPDDGVVYRNAGAQPQQQPPQPQPQNSYMGIETPDNANQVLSPLTQAIAGMQPLQNNVLQAPIAIQPQGNPGMMGGATTAPQAFNPLGDRYNAQVQEQVAAANAAGRNVGTGGAGYEWNGQNFVRSQNRGMM